MIKQLLASLSAAVFLGVCLLILPCTLCFADGERYTFYCGDTSLDCREVRTNTPALVKPFLQKVNGEAAFYDSFDLDAFLADVNGTVLFCEQLSDSTNYYCSADLPYTITLYGRQINLHICVTQEGVTVASPIIFGGY